MTTKKTNIKKHLNNIYIQQQQKIMEHLEAFNDGIIAIIITIMVLELPIPHALNTYPHFLKAVSVFLISFFIVANFWYHLTTLYNSIDRATKGIVIVDLMYLADLAIMPALTTWLIEAPSVLAVINYGVIYMIAQIFIVWLRHLIFKFHLSLVLSNERANITAEYSNKKVRLRTFSLLILNIIFIALSFIIPEIIIYAYLALPLLDFFLPTKNSSKKLTITKKMD